MRPPAYLVLAALVLVGSAMAQTTMMTFTGTVAGGGFGRPITSAGDINGDGIPDFAFGLPGAGPAGELRYRSGWDGSHLRTVLGTTAGEAFADHIIQMGDVDNDGVGDIAAGAPSAAAGAGQIRIISGATGGIIRTITGAAGSLLHLGAAGGDFNNDGVPDVCGIAWGGLGELTVYSGASGATITTISYPFGGLTAWGSWLNASFINDLNGDGFDDLLIGSSYGAGRAIAVRGPNGAFHNGVDGPSPNTELGSEVADLGDVDGDGIHDIGFGARDANTLPSGSFTQVRSGASFSLLYTLWGLILSPASTPGFGGRMAALGDVTGDGFGDFALGGGGLGLSPGVSVISGPAGTVVWSILALGNCYVAAAGDINGDFKSELIVGTANYPNPGTSVGNVKIISTPTLGAALSASLGGGCGAFGPPVLTVSPPVIGGTVTFSLSGATPFAAGNIALDAAPPVLSVFGPCAWFLDLAHGASWTMLPVAANATGGFAFGVGVPAVPLFAGVPVVIQTVLFGTGGPLGFDVSNAVGTIVGF